MYLPRLSNISLASTTSLPVFALVYPPLIRAACTLHPASLVVQVLVVGSRSVGRCWGGVLLSLVRLYVATKLPSVQKFLLLWVVWPSC